MEETKMPKFKKSVKKDSIGEEIIRLVSTRSEDGKRVAPLLVSSSVSFAHFILMLVASHPSYEDEPTLTDILGVLNGSDLIRHVGLLNCLSQFLPVWFDMDIQDNITDFDAEKIADAYNKFVININRKDGEDGKTHRSAL